MPIYMRFGSIKGEVTEGGHKDWIELSSLQWGVGRGVSSATGSTYSREASLPSVSEITVTKSQDSASTHLMHEAFAGNGKGDGDQVVIEFVRTASGSAPALVFHSITLSKVIISGFSSSSGGDRPSESLSLNFVKIEVGVNPMKADGTGAGDSKFAYDLGISQVA